MWNHLDLYLHYFTATTTTPDGPIATVTSTLTTSTVIPGAESSQLTTKFVKTANGGFVVRDGSLITGRRCYKMWIGGGQSYGLQLCEGVGRKCSKGAQELELLMLKRGGQNISTI